MPNTQVIGIVGIVSFLFLAIFISLKWVGYQNEEATLRTKIEGSIDVHKDRYNKMVQVITGKAQVTEKYADDFGAIYAEIVSGRYQDEGSTFMKWIQEDNPNLDASLYKDLMLSIEAERNGLTQHYQQMRDMKAQHDILLRTVPSKWFLSGVSEIEVPLIVTESTKKVFDTGIEQEIQVF